MKIDEYFFFKLIFEVDGGWLNWNVWLFCLSFIGDGWRICVCMCSNLFLLNGGYDCVGLLFNFVVCLLIFIFGLFLYFYLFLMLFDIL